MDDIYKKALNLAIQDIASLCSNIEICKNCALTKKCPYDYNEQIKTDKELINYYIKKARKG